jgi:hypothetical protein
MRPCDSVSAFAQMLGTARSTRAPVVSLDDVREHACVGLHTAFVGVDAEDLVAHLDQRRRKRGSESTEADHDDLAAVDHLGSQSLHQGVNRLVSQ